MYVDERLSVTVVGVEVKEGVGVRVGVRVRDRGRGASDPQFRTAINGIAEVTESPSVNSKGTGEVTLVKENAGVSVHESKSKSIVGMVATGRVGRDTPVNNCGQARA